jgi:NTP pyrophosphatase (non-canonical NTP hydrolase)
MLGENFSRVSEEVIKQNQEIHSFRSDTILAVAQMITCEVMELNEAIQEAFLTDDLTSVASEAGDCLYLLMRLFEMLGLDERAVEMKIKRNYLKYYGFDTKEQACSEWKESDGDKRFFELYLDKFAKED